MAPAEQGLQADHGAARRLQLRLVVELELVAGQRRAQLALQRQALDRRGAEPAAVELEIAAALPLGMVHGEVGVLQQGLRIVAVIGEERDPDAGADHHRLLAQIERMVERREHPLGDPGRVLGPPELAEHDRELVAAEPGDRRLRTVAALARDEIGAAQAGRQAMREGLQQAVAGVVAEVVVDQLEMIEVEEQHRAAAAVAARFGERLTAAAAGTEAGWAAW